MNKYLIMLKEPRVILLNIIKRKPFHTLSDERYLKLKFRLVMNEKLNLKTPKTFNEKLQWLKLYDRKDVYTRMADKYEVRKIIQKKLGDEYLIPLYGVYDSYEQIDFSSLPDKFVIKPTHTSGDVFICNNKSNIDHKYLKKEIGKWLKREYFWLHREWPYKNIKPRIIIEEYLEDLNHNDLKDYKLMMFNGKLECTLVVSNRNTKNAVNSDFFDSNWNHLPFGRPGRTFCKEVIEKPLNYGKMVEFSKELSKDSSFMRVDFYEVNGKLYFGETTFYPGAGFEKFEPHVYDETLGKSLILNQMI